MTDTTRRKRIGVFIEWLSDGYSDPILEEVVAVAGRRGVDIRCFVGGCNESDIPVMRRHVPLAYASPHVIDGAIVVSLGNGVTDGDIETSFRRFEPIPLCGMAVRWSRYPRIEVDNESGLRTGLRHLIQKHRRRKIACIRGPAKSLEAEKRFGVYREVLSEFGLPDDDRYVVEGYYMRNHGANAVRLLLDERKLDVDAIVAANDAMALGALEELDRRGIRVPENVALFGFDDIEEARHARPPLSTVRQPFRDHARKAFESVMDQLEGRAVPAQTFIDSELILRRSCGCSLSRGWMLSSAPPPPESRPTEELASWVRECARALVEFFARCGPAEDLDRQFGSTLLHAAKTGDSHAFLDLLDAHLEHAGRACGDLLLILPVLYSRQRALRSVALEAVELDCLDNALRAATALASEAAERIEAQQRHSAKTQINRLLRMNEALMHAQDLAGLAQVLARHLPELGVRGCYACLLEGEAVPAEFARLVLACDSGTVRPVPREGLRFPARDVLPSELGLDGTPSSWLVCPILRLDTTAASYVVLLLGTAEAFVYDALVDQIGSHFKRLDLMQRLESANRQLEMAAHTDALTQLHNRRSFMSQFETEFERAKRHGIDLSFAIIDLDHFKQVNDTYGHLAGDLVLRRVAEILTASRRRSDLVGRYGGEELCLVLEHTALEDAVAVAEALRSAIGELELVSDGRRFHVTASIGVAQAAPGDQSIEDIVRRADKALYRAKNNGRNRVERAGAE